MERTYREAVRHARERLKASRRPVGVAVRRCWFDAEADGARAQVVITNGLRHVAPEAPVLVLRARLRLDVAAVEDVLEAHAMAYPNATAMQELALDVAEQSAALGVHLEQIWLESRAA